MRRRVVRHANRQPRCIPDPQWLACPAPWSVIDLDRLLALVRALNREGVEYAVVGAVALGLHGLARATEDMDLFVRPTPDNIARLRRAMSAVWSDPDIDAITAGDGAAGCASSRRWICGGCDVIATWEKRRGTGRRR